MLGRSLCVGVAGQIPNLPVADGVFERSRAEPQTQGIMILGLS